MFIFYFIPTIINKKYEYTNEYNNQEINIKSIIKY